ncbi:MAG TPA: hypothetical protein VFF68_10085 [Anaerolineaceae bacterium]|nr:hypothetical protein [Anaerolineaceae bacterium]
MKCQICESDPAGFQWTDLHGEAICSTCGTPYQILQYDENKKRIEAEPKINIKAEYIPWMQRYWQETKRFMGLGTYMRIPRPDDYDAFMSWMDKNCTIEPEPTTN